MSTNLTPITSNQLPSPKGNWITGHFSQFKANNKHQVLEGWVREVGDVLRIRLLTKRFIVCANTNINKEILKQRPDAFRRFNKIDEVLQEMGIMGVFNAEGEAWKKHRLITSEALNRTNVERFFPTIKTVTQRLISKWNNRVDNAEAFDVQKEMMRYTVDTTTAIAFGYQMNTLEKGEDVIQNHMEKIFPMINSRIIAPLPLWRFIKSKKDKAFDFSLSEVKKTVNDLIIQGKEKLANNPKTQKTPNNFLEAMLIEQEKDGNFSDEEIFGNVFTMLLAGEDTTSNTISWTLYFLAEHPDIVNKIREEAKATYGQEKIPSEFRDLNLLKYTEAVVQESLRICPVTPNLYMMALKDVVIENHLFKAGETIMLQNKVAQTNEKNFIRPDEFMPERWLSKGCPIHGGAHKPETILSFGGGSRFCPGKGLALSQLILTISTICKNFDFELTVSPDDVKQYFAFTMFPENLVMKVKKVKS